MVPASVRRQLGVALSRPLFQDRKSYRTFWRAWEDPRHEAELIEVRMRPLGGETVVLRTGTDDLPVLLDTFIGRYHLPPLNMRRSIRTIWDLGSHIGLTVGHMAHLFREAHVTACEMDHDNVTMCRQNVQHWQDRINILETAIVGKAGVVNYVRDSNRRSSISVRDPHAAAHTFQAAGRSLPELFEEREVEHVDYLKVDIEGAEEFLLGGDVSWSSQVTCINVEVHPPYDIDRCVDDLSALGFTVKRNWKHRASLTGFRSRDATDLPLIR